jgi:protein FAM50
VTESIDDRLKNKTVGLVSLEDFQKTRLDLEEEQRQVAAKTAGQGYVHDPHYKPRLTGRASSSKTKKTKRKEKSKLSFEDDEDEEGSPNGTKRSRSPSTGRCSRGRGPSSF